MTKTNSVIDKSVVIFSLDQIKDGDPVESIQAIKDIMHPVLCNLYKDRDYVRAVLDSSVDFIHLGYDEASDGDTYSVVIQSYGSIGFSNGILTE